MAFTFNDFKNKVNNKTQAAAQNQSAVQQEELSFEDCGLFGKTKIVAQKAAKSVKEVAPVTNRKFNKAVEEFNARHNQHEREIDKNRLLAHIIANAAGIELPSEEELDQMYDEAMAMEEEVEEIVEEPVEEPIAEEEPIVEQEPVVEEEPEQTGARPRRKLGRQKPIGEDDNFNYGVMV